ncbi:hypothetical protein LFL97_11055 [Burkholderia sp. JSH-S8]|nr:hypothetical protein LFL97_11055 [Burkholderia sp. JSH-S8]
MLEDGGATPTLSGRRAGACAARASSRFVVPVGAAWLGNAPRAVGQASIARDPEDAVLLRTIIGRGERGLVTDDRTAR